jgi:DNA-binding NarL/FixJ family response regulator
MVVAGNGHDLSRAGKTGMATKSRHKKTKKIRIVLADDHRIVRQGIHVLLDIEPDLQVIGEAADGVEAVRLVKSLQPDILVADLEMGGMNGFEVTREVGKCSPVTGIIILSMHINDAYVLEAFQVGASAYVLKESGLDELVRAIHEVVSGHLYLSPPLSPKGMEVYREKVNNSEMGH